MKILLKLRHWQLFALTWGLPLLINILTLSNPSLLLRLFPLYMLLFMLGIFGWVWAISTGLHKKLPMDVKLNLSRFKLLFLIPFVYILCITIWISLSQFTNLNTSGLPAPLLTVFIFTFHLISMVCIFLSIRFAAKTIKSLELGRMAKFGDYIGEFFLIWFSPIGIWILQPRLNRLCES